MNGVLHGDEPEPPADDLIEEQVKLRYSIVNTATARARLEYERTHLGWSTGGRNDSAAKVQSYTAQIEALSRLEGAMREREALLTRRIRDRAGDGQ